MTGKILVMVLWGAITVGCIAGVILAFTIDLWQSAIPLAALAGIFGYMTYRDIRDIIRVRKKRA